MGSLAMLPPLRQVLRVDLSRSRTLVSRNTMKMPDSSSTRMVASTSTLTKLRHRMMQGLLRRLRTRTLEFPKARP